MVKIDTTKSRFRDALWFNKIDEYKIPIIIGGVGGIGSWLTLFLSRVVSSETPIIIYDMDVVEDINLAGQLYRIKDIGKLKVNAVGEMVAEFSRNPNIVMDKRYDASSLSSPIMFSAFDNMSSRKIMFDKWKEDAKGYNESLFIDGRLLAEQLQVFFVTPERIPLYEKYLFNDSEVADLSCSYKQTSHFAATIAAKMVQGFTNWFVRDTAELPFFYEEIGNLFLATTKNE